VLNSVWHLNKRMDENLWTKTRSIERTPFLMTHSFFWLWKFFFSKSNNGRWRFQHSPFQLKTKLDHSAQCFWGGTWGCEKI
jgi:hypothetical protein